MLAMRQAQGFTLLELMITVVVLAIITAIAYPSYQVHVLKSHRNAVQTEMTQLAQNFDRCRTRSNAYDACGLVEAFDDELSESERYRFSISAERAAFSIEAEPLAAGNQQNDKCETLSLNHLGVRGTNATGLTAADCW